MIQMTQIRRRVSALVACSTAAAGFAAFGAAQPPPASIHTEAQAERGRAAYEKECASCHGSDLSGSFEAPALAGENFLTFWRDLTPRDLFQRVRASMPQNRPGSLSADTYVDIVAYVLAANGAPSGNAALTAETAVPIGAVAGRQPTARPAPVPAPAAQAASAPSEPAGFPARGLTVSGKIANFRPVTDAELRNPSPDDWLMIRGNYSAWSHSSLVEITRENVGKLQLAWV
jgi:mono/diheme cytochrome c family protein